MSSSFKSSVIEVQVQPTLSRLQCVLFIMQQHVVVTFLILKVMAEIIQVRLPHCVNSQPDDDTLSSSCHQSVHWHKDMTRHEFQINVFGEISSQNKSNAEPDSDKDTVSRRKWKKKKSVCLTWRKMIPLKKTQLKGKRMFKKKECHSSFNHLNLSYLRECAECTATRLKHWQFLSLNICSCGAISLNCLQ